MNIGLISIKLNTFLHSKWIIMICYHKRNSTHCQYIILLKHLTVHCTVYNVQCTLYSVQNTLYNVHCIVYKIHCTMYTV